MPAGVRTIIYGAKENVISIAINRSIAMLTPSITIHHISRAKREALRPLWRRPAIALACLAIVSLNPFSAYAANPATGSVTATTGSSVTFTGSAVGTGGANGEGDCVDGVSCDTFALTVSGNPADYSGKVVAIRLNWTVPA